MESQQELEQKLVAYGQQMGQVDSLLQLDANNSEFLKLKSDLFHLISLTKDLLIKVIGGSGNSNSNGKDDLIEDVPIAPAASDTAASSSNGGEALQELSPKTGPIEVGEVVEVLGGERLYAGVVVGIINGTEYKIKYYEYPDEVSLPSSSLQRIPPSAGQFNPSEAATVITIGFKCMCKYSTDQNWYNAVVTDITKYGYMVTYTEYGNSEEVPLAYMRPIKAATSGTGSSSGGAVDIGISSSTNSSAAAAALSSLSTSVAQIVTKPIGNIRNPKIGADGLIVIPDSLQIQPTDTEKEIERKKKDLKTIKSRNRLISKEKDIQGAQQSWQSFMTKKAPGGSSGSNKRSSSSGGGGGSSGIGARSSSMFSSEGAGKVGVINSGKGMTSFTQRKKHKFDQF